MNKEEILRLLGDFGTSVLEALKVAGAFIWEQLENFFSWAVESISVWLSTLTLPMLPTFMKIFSNKSINKGIFFVVVAFLVIMNIWAFMLYGIDKKKAASKKYRIPEKKLMKVCFWGGAAGGLIGMLIFRHKTQHKKFTVSIPVMFVIQLVLYSFILGFLGFWAFF